MSAEPPPPPTPGRRKPTKASPTQFFLRGLAIVLPPILTLLILIWVGQMIYGYVVRPTSTVVQYTIAQVINDARPSDSLKPVPGPKDQVPQLEAYADTDYLVTEEARRRLEPMETVRSDDLNLSRVYIPIGDGRWAVPYDDYAAVARHLSAAEIPRHVVGVPWKPGFYMEVVTSKHFQGLFHLSAVAVIALVVALYFLGRFVTARIGAWFVHKFETGVMGRVPLVSNVYSSVKQVTDFLLSERTVEYNRVVAVEYPRRGVWSLGFATGNSLREITETAREPLVSILIATSPMPMTGFTINVPRREVLDLDITVDQAFQFCLSCGVLVPPQQRVTAETLGQEVAQRLPTDGSETSSDEEPRETAGDGQRSVREAPAPEKHSHQSEASP